MKVSWFNYVVLFVSLFERVVDFYIDVFGFEVIVWELWVNVVFLCILDLGNYYDFGLFGFGVDVLLKMCGGIGFYYLVW